MSMNGILGAIILGSLFGGALYYVGASNPRKLLKMLRLEDLAIMKIIVFAIGFSNVLLALAAFTGVFNLTHLSVKTMNVGVIIGGLIFGIGFGLLGTCPGTCMAAVGSFGMKQALATVKGGVLGALSFSLVYEWLVKNGLVNSLNYGKLTIFNVSKKFPAVLDIGFSGLLIVGVGLMLFALYLPQLKTNSYKN